MTTARAADGGAVVTLRATTPGDADLSPPRSGRRRGGRHLPARRRGGRPGANILRIEKNGYAPTRNPPAGGCPSAAGRPRPGVAVPGRVAPVPGKSAAGAVVRFEGRVESRWVESGPDGIFTIRDAPEGKGRLVADAGEAGFGEVTGLVLPISEGKSATVPLGRPASLEGRAVDSKTLRGSRGRR